MATISPNEFFKSNVTSLNSPIQTPKVTRFSDFLNSDIPEFKQSFDRTASSLDDEIKSINQRDISGQNRMSSLLQRTGAYGTALGRGIGDVVNLGLKAFAKPETEKAVAGVVSDVGTAIAGTDVVQEIGAKYKQIEQTNPELAANIRGALGVGSAALIGAGMPLGGGGLNAVGGATRGLVEKIASESTNVLRGITDVGSSGITKAVESGLKPASIMQRVARISKGKQAEFEGIAKESIGSYLVNRGIFGDIDSITSQLYKRFEQSKGAVDEALSTLPGEYRPAPVRVALDELFARESRISSPGVPSRDLERVKELYNKVQQQGLTMSEINEVKRLYERNVKLDYLKQNLPEAVAKANTVDSVLRNWQFAKANELGLKNLPELNKETQLAKQLMDDLGKEYAGSAGNNAITLSDWIVLSGGDPTAIGAFIIKKGASSKKFMSSVAEKLAPPPSIGEPTAKIAEPTMSGYAKWVDSIEGRTKQPVEPPIKIEASPSVNDNTSGKTSPAVGQTATNANTTAQTTAIPKIQPIVKNPNFIDRIIQQYKNLPNKEGGFVRLPSGEKIKAIDAATKEEILQLITYLKTSKVGSQIKSYGGAEKALQLIGEKYGIDVENLSTAKIIQKLNNLLDKTKTMDYLPGGEKNFLQKLLQTYKDTPNKQGGFANLGEDIFPKKADSLESQAKGKTLEEFLTSKLTPPEIKTDTVNGNKVVTLYHGTSKTNADKIRKEGILRIGGEDSDIPNKVFLASSPERAKEFGTDIIEVKMRLGDKNLTNIDNTDLTYNTDIKLPPYTKSQLTDIYNKAHGISNPVKYQKNIDRGIKVDDINKELINKNTFTIDHGYPVAMINGKKTYLHSLVMEGQKEKGLVIDHINGNKLDNRVENLRVISQKGNTSNRVLSKVNTSGTTGVKWDGRINKWIASIAPDGKTIHLGSYSEIGDAIKARKQAEVKYFEPLWKKANGGTVPSDASPSGRSPI